MIATRRFAQAVMAAAIAFGTGAGAQTPAPAQPAPPASTSPAAPGQGSGAAIVQSPAPNAPAPASPAPPPGATAQTTRPTLIPQPGDPSNVDEVVLPERDVLILSGSAKWDDALPTIRGAIGKIEAELAKAGIAPAGRPLALFTTTTDEDFHFDAMVPVDRVPAGASVPSEMRWGKTPAGKAYRFTHKAAYEEIDQTYETITTYLDAKDVVAKDAFIEEYVNDVSDPGDTGMEVNIFVQPK